MRLRSLRALTVAFLCIFLAVTVLSGLALYSATTNTMRDLVDERIASESKSLAPVGFAVDRDDLLRRIGELSRKRDTGDLGFVVTDSTGRQIAGNVRLMRPLTKGYWSIGTDQQIKGLTSGRALVRDIGDGLRLTVIAETEPIDNYEAARARIYLIGFAAITAVVLTSLVLFRRLIGTRILEMRGTVDAIIDGDLKQRVPVNGVGDEFDLQAAAFNRMLDRIGALMSEIRNVTNDIAHELRTPLARLRNELALIERRDAALPIQEELAGTIEQADDLLAMFSAMLRIAEVESGSRRAGFAPIDLGALAVEVAETLDAVARESGHRLTWDRCARADCVGDRQLLTQMMINLAENALRHTPAGSLIEIGVSRWPGSIIFSVIDDGPGIAAEERARVMRRFGRLERSRASEGHGLGLPLVDAIARLHGGGLHLDDAQPGLKATVTLPQDH